MRQRTADTTLFWLAMVTSLIGLVFILDSGYVQSMNMGGGLLAKPFVNQCIWLALSVGLFFLCRRINVGWVKKNFRIVIGVAMLALVAVEVIGVAQNGAKRWLGFGQFLLQPAEFMKLAIVIFLAGALYKKKDWRQTWETRRSKRDWTNRVLVPKLERLWPAFVVLVVFVLVEREKDLGTACVILATSIAMFLSAPVTGKSVSILGGLLALALVVFVVFVPYRAQRFIVHPQRWERENINHDSYQTIHSELAMASGGITGTGFGSGRAKHMLPATTTDFIMATVAEECGLWGPLICLGLIGTMVFKLFQLAAKVEEDRFSYFILLGVAWWLSIQAATNLAMANATIPAIGIPFPFISAGGSSLIALWLALGVCDRVAQPELAKVKKEVKRANRYHWWWNRRTRLPGA